MASKKSDAPTTYRLLAAVPIPTGAGKAEGQPQWTGARVDRGAVLETTDEAVYNRLLSLAYGRPA